MPTIFDQLRGLWFSEVSVTAPTSGSILPAKFIVRRGYEGPQIYVEWGAPQATGLIFQLVLVKRLFGFPASPQDDRGEIIYQGPPIAQSISDRNVEPGVFYYYKLFAVMMDSSIVSDALHQGQVMALKTGFYAEKMWDVLPEEYKNSDKRPDLAGNTKLRLYEGPGSQPGATAEVFNFGEDGSLAKGQYRRFLKLFGPPLDEAKGLTDFLINQLDFDLASLTNLDFLAQMLGLDLNKELKPEKFRNEARLQVAYLKIKGTKPGLIARLRAVSNANPTISEQFNNVLYSNRLDRTSLKFIAAESLGISSADDIIARSVGYPDTAPFWLWFNVFMDAPETIPLDEVTVRKWCISIAEGSPACHKGDLYVTGYVGDTARVVALDSPGQEEEDSDDVDAASIKAKNGISDTLQIDATKYLIISDPTKLISQNNFGAVFPGIPAGYTSPTTSG